MKKSPYLVTLDLGFSCMFDPWFSPGEILDGCTSPLEDLTFRGGGLDMNMKVQFLLDGCRSINSLRRLDVCLLKIVDSSSRVAQFFDTPLAFLIEDGLHAQEEAEEPIVMEDSEEEREDLEEEGDEADEAEDPSQIFVALQVDGTSPGKQMPRYEVKMDGQRVLVKDEGRLRVQ